VRTKILRQIPLLDTASLITRNEFALIRVDADVVDCRISGEDICISKTDLTRCTIVIITM